jgi:TRAP-type C4-dicarboxylate transport system substrate-binding protein
MDTLPPEIQELIYETADEAGEYYTSLVEEKGAEAIQMCKDKGIVVIEDADLSEWYAACADLGYDLEASGYLPEGITDSVKALK